MCVCVCVCVCVSVCMCVGYLSVDVNECVYILESSIAIQASAFKGFHLLTSSPFNLLYNRYYSFIIYLVYITSLNIIAYIVFYAQRLI